MAVIRTPFENKAKSTKKRKKIRNIKKGILSTIKVKSIIKYFKLLNIFYKKILLYFSIALVDNLVLDNAL